MFHDNPMQRAHNAAMMTHARFDAAHRAQTGRDARQQHRPETRRKKRPSTPPQEIWQPCDQGCRILANYGVSYLNCMYECTKGGGWTPSKASGGQWGGVVLPGAQARSTVPQQAAEAARRLTSGGNAVCAEMGHPGWCYDASKARCVPCNQMAPQRGTRLSRGRAQPRNAPPPEKTCPPGYTLGPSGCEDGSGNPPPGTGGWPTLPGTMSLPDVTPMRATRAAYLRRTNSHLGKQPADTFKYSARLLRHYADELLGLLQDGDQLPQWVEMKMALIWSDVSDVSHHMRDELTRMMPPTGRASNFWRRARNFGYPIPRKRNGPDHGSYMTPYALTVIRQYADWLDQNVPDEWGVPDWAEFKLARASGRLDDVAHYVEYMRGRGLPLVQDHMPEDMIIETVVVQPRGEGGMLDVEGLSYQDRMANPCTTCQMLMVAGRKKNSCYPGASVFLDNMRWMYPPNTQTYVQGY